MNAKRVSKLIINFIFHKNYLSTKLKCSQKYLLKSNKILLIRNQILGVTSIEIQKVFTSKQGLSSHRNPKSFQNSSSHRIFRHVHEALNIDENKN